MVKILVIEDEAELLSEVIDWLTFENYEVLGAPDGIVGVEYTNTFLPDLIVCDITMPRLDGYGVLVEVRSNPASATIPFIFITARASHEDIRQGMALGADDYVTKPFTHRELLQTVQSRLAKKDVLEKNNQMEVKQWQQAFEQEREQRLLKAKLIAMFSHDFRNPLTSILSSSNLLQHYANRMDEKRQQIHWNRIDGAVHQLMQMLEDMLWVAQAESNSFDFKPEPLQIEQFLRNIVEEFQVMHGETHHLVYESHFAETLMADPRLLRQIVVNLISNAIKYSPTKTEVRVLLDRHDGQVTVMVQDQGIGIPESDRLRLFNAFQRGSNVGDLSGTGLGLAIVKQAVNLQGGSVTLESVIGVGTKITVALPV